MLAHANAARDTAVDLGDTALIAAGTTFQRSLRLPDDAARIIGTLSDLSAVPSKYSPQVESAVYQSRAAIRAVIGRSPYSASKSGTTQPSLAIA